MQLGLTVGKVVSGACGVPIGGVIDVLKGAIKGISNNEITDSDVATNLALLTTSNSQFWAPLLDQTKEVLALTLDKKDDTKKFGDILLEGSKKLKESAKFYRFSVSPTSWLKSDLLRNLESPGSVTIALEELKKLILYENIKNGADGIEISKDLFLGNNNEFAANGSLTSPTACNLLNEAMKQLYFMGEESRVAENSLLFPKNKSLLISIPSAPLLIFSYKINFFNSSSAIVTDPGLSKFRNKSDFRPLVGDTEKR